MMYRFLILTMLICLILPVASNAQEIDKTNIQLWLDYYPSFYFSDKLQFTGDTGYRTILGESNWQMMYVRPSLSYYPSKTFAINGGIGLFYEFNRQNSDRFEVRPWQGVRIYWPKFKKLGLSRFSIDHWLRLEQRFSFLTEDNFDYSFDLRGRYKLSGKIKLCWECADPKWSLPFYGEVFVSLENVKEIYRNRGRLGVGLDFDPKSAWSYGFLFHWQGSRAGVDENINVSDYIIQFKIRHKFDRKPGLFEF